jgi:hypothetical protein
MMHCLIKSLFKFSREETQKLQRMRRKNFFSFAMIHGQNNLSFSLVSRFPLRLAEAFRAEHSSHSPRCLVCSLSEIIFASIQTHTEQRTEMEWKGKQNNFEIRSFDCYGNWQEAH